MAEPSGWQAAKDVEPHEIRDGSLSEETWIRCTLPPGLVGSKLFQKVCASSGSTGWSSGASKEGDNPKLDAASGDAAIPGGAAACSRTRARETRKSFRAGSCGNTNNSNHNHNTISNNNNNHYNNSADSYHHNSSNDKYNDNNNNNKKRQP